MLLSSLYYLRYVETGSDDASLGLTPAGNSHRKEKQREKEREAREKEGKDGSLVVGNSSSTTVSGGDSGSGSGNDGMNSSVAATTGAHATEIAGVEVSR